MLEIGTARLAWPNLGSNGHLRWSVVIIFLIFYILLLYWYSHVTFYVLLYILLTTYFCTSLISTFITFCHRAQHYFNRNKHTSYWWGLRNNSPIPWHCLCSAFLVAWALPAEVLPLEAIGSCLDQLGLGRIRSLYSRSIGSRQFGAASHSSLQVHRKLPS